MTHGKPIDPGNAMADPRRLTLFDLDNTLLAGDSDYGWALFLIEIGVLDRDEYERRNQEFYDDYKAGRLDIHAFLDFQLRPLARYPTAELEAWRARFVEAKIRPMMTAEGRRVVAERIDAGDLVAIITSTNSFVTRPIADLFGISHLIATEPEMVDGRYTGGVSGTPSFREGKVERLDDWLRGMGRSLESFRESWFYSDSQNDLPLLERVSHPVAVDPDPTLAAAAVRLGWPVLHWRAPLHV